MADFLNDAVLGLFRIAAVPWFGPTASEIASKYRHTRFVDHLMDINRSAKPRMPAIKNLAPVVKERLIYRLGYADFGAIGL